MNQILNRFYLIIIDTEDDNLWEASHDITVENARYLPRFQELCEQYGLKPVYLTNYEMAVSDVFREFVNIYCNAEQEKLACTYMPGIALQCTPSQKMIRCIDHISLNIPYQLWSKKLTI